MKTLVFAKRNLKELIRDPISLIFSIGLPLFLIVIFQQFNIPSDVYKIENFGPSIIIFSYSFISLFTGLLVAKDRTTSFLTRLFSSPLSILNYIVGYSIAIVPLAIVQSTLFLIVSSFYGLTLGINTIITILLMIPISFLFVGFGILIGCAFNDKQAPGVASLIIQFVAFTSGMWFDIDMIGNTFFKTLCNILPFRYAVDIARLSLNGNYNDMFKPFLIIFLFIIIVYALAALIFKKQMRK